MRTLVSMTVCPYISIKNGKVARGGQSHVSNSVSTDVYVCFSSVIYLSFAIQAPHTAALTPLDKEVTDSITESSLFQPVYKNNSLDLKEKGRKKTSLS